MTYLLASVPLKLREIAPVNFVPLAVLLILLVQREVIRARPGQQLQQRTALRLLDLAILPLLALFLFFAGLNAYTVAG